MRDLALEFDAWADIIRERTSAIHRAVPRNLSDDLVTQDRLKLAQQIAQRLEAVLQEFDLREPSDSGASR